jgi:putative ABC transport system substrate-binding protein
MSRVAFASLIFAAALVSALPLGAQQQQAANPIVGFLTSGSLSALNKDWAEGFRKGLGESGFVEGQNVTIQYRAADDRYDRLPGLAAELVRNNVGVIVAAGGPVSALAARKATDSVPIVFTTIADPVKSGLVASLNRPGGNVTGMAGLTSELDVKRLELLLQIKPTARLIGVLVNPNRPGVETNSMELEAAAYKVGRQLVFQNGGTEHPLEAAFQKLAEQKIDALVVTADPFFNFRRPQVVALAARYNMPAIYQWREFVADGGLMSYGPSIGDAYHHAGVYAGRILKGAKPADLPVTQPTRFELVINQRAAKALGLEISPLLHAAADSVTQ